MLSERLYNEYLPIIIKMNNQFLKTMWILLIHLPLDSKMELLVLQTCYRRVEHKYLQLVMIKLFFFYLIYVKCNVKCPIIVPQFLLGP